jgi:hypothetical protein
MEESKNILYNLSLQNYLKHTIKIDNKISKSYQMEILSKILHKELTFNLKSEFSFNIHMYSRDEYKTTIDDIKNVIKKIYKLKDFDINFFKEMIKNLYNIEEDDNSNISWSHHPKILNFLWFELIEIENYNFTESYLKLSFKINIDLMIKLFKYRNLVIYIQRKYVDKLYKPPNGILCQKGYNEIKKLLN